MESRHLGGFRRGAFQRDRTRTISKNRISRLKPAGEWDILVSILPARVGPLDFKTQVRFVKEMTSDELYFAIAGDDHR